MSTTVLEALQNAHYNFMAISSHEELGNRLTQNPIYIIGMEQLKNGITALKNGKSPNEIIQEDMLSEVDVGKET